MKKLLIIVPFNVSKHWLLSSFTTPITDMKRLSQEKSSENLFIVANLIIQNYLKIHL